MSNSHEPSYYEVALTNRQVVVAFVILLVCLLCAFFSGVWIGRESTMRAQQQLSESSAPAQAEKKEGQVIEEFDFFDDSQRPAAAPVPEPEPPQPAPQQTVPEPDQDSTLLEDLGGEGDDADLEEPPADLDPSTDPVPDPPRPAAESRRPAPATERPAERSEPVRPRPLPEAEAAPAGRGDVVIQVFSSAEKDQAERIRERLVSGGHKAYLSPVEVGGRTMYRVRIGPFENRQAADQVAEKVRKGYKLDTWVTE